MIVKFCCFLEIFQGIEDRKKTKIRRCAESNSQRIRELDQTYNELNKNTKRSVRRDWKKYLDDLAEEKAQSAVYMRHKVASMGHLFKVYKAISKLSRMSAQSRVPVKDKAGKVLANMEEQLRRWREYFEEVLNHPSETPKVFRETISSRTHSCSAIHSTNPIHKTVTLFIKKVINYSQFYQSFNVS
jgi:hypothetical protein